MFRPILEAGKCLHRLFVCLICTCKIDLGGWAEIMFDLYVCACVCVCVCEREIVTQLCLTLYYPIDCSLPGSSVPGILQERIILDWVVMPFSSLMYIPGEFSVLSKHTIEK